MIFVFSSATISDDGATDGSVRLAGGTSFSNGRVEIFYRGEWGTVCDDKWTTTNARVTCLQLGFTGVANAYQSFGPGRGRVWMDQVNCRGSETSLLECPQRGWANTPCSHSEDVGIVCSGGLPKAFPVFKKYHAYSFRALPNNLQRNSEFRFLWGKRKSKYFDS